MGKVTLTYKYFRSVTELHRRFYNPKSSVQQNNRGAKPTKQCNTSNFITSPLPSLVWGPPPKKGFPPYSLSAIVILSKYAVYCLFNRPISYTVYVLWKCAHTLIMYALPLETDQQCIIIKISYCIFFVNSDIIQDARCTSYYKHVFIRLDMQGKKGLRFYCSILLFEYNCIQLLAHFLCINRTMKRQPRERYYRKLFIL
eukprot:TRINITY_DN1573_c12_g1_i2.p1 TRINITY_DN1573_c12_g1~~TRINITY_DN1573_c12_g1_i2.p1  ORF type:complete len:199 (-),score=-11.86 TRINITY_DN1573_c12_g1_i2:15-611(-)